MRWRRATIAIPLVLMAAALIVRIYGLADKPFWLDEITTQRRLNLSISDLFSDSFHFGQYPTYFALIRALHLPTFDEWALRLPSAIFGAISVLLVALIATDARSPRALSPFEVQYGQEARPGALVSCCVLLALWGLVRIAKQASAGTLPSNSLKSPFGSWITYTIGTICALNVQFVSVPWLLASNLAIVAVARHSGLKRYELIRNWMVAQAVIALAWVPGLIAICLATHEDPVRNLRWIPPFTLENLWSVFSAVYLFRASDLITFELLPTLIPGFGVAVVALAILGAWRLKDDRTMFNTIGLAVIAMPTTILLASIFYPMLVPRYFIWSTGPFFVLAGIGAASLSVPAYSLIAAVLSVGGVVNLAPYYRYETKPRWDLAAAYLDTNVQPDDTIVVNSDMEQSVLNAFGDRYHPDRKMLSTAFAMEDAANRYAQAKRIWVVYGRAGQGIMETEESYLQKWLTFGTPVSRIRFGKHVVIVRFDSPRSRSTVEDE
jgi:mannosyltransferase